MSGGKGILLAGEIIAQAAMIAGHDVKTNEVHGMAQRGGSVMAEIRFGCEGFSPLVPEGGAQVIASLERLESLRYFRDLAPGGLAVVSSEMIVPVTVCRARRHTQTMSNMPPPHIPQTDLSLCRGHRHIARQRPGRQHSFISALAKELPIPQDAWQEALNNVLS